MGVAPPALDQALISRPGHPDRTDDRRTKPAIGLEDDGVAEELTFRILSRTFGSGRIYRTDVGVFRMSWLNRLSRLDWTPILRAPSRRLSIQF